MFTITKKYFFVIFTLCIMSFALVMSTSMSYAQTPTPTPKPTLVPTPEMLKLVTQPQSRPIDRPAHSNVEPGPNDTRTNILLYDQKYRPNARGDEAVHWDFCTHIKWKFSNPTWADDTQIASLAVDKISRTTGFKFVQVSPKSSADLIFTVSNEQKIPVLKGAKAVTDITPVKDSPTTWWRYTKAHIYFNSNDFHYTGLYKYMYYQDRNIFTIRGGFKSRLHTTIHEIGHVLGLHHPNWRYGPNSNSLMATGNDLLEFNSGDLAGLKKVGRKNGCMTEPKMPTVVGDVPAVNKNISVANIVQPFDPHRVLIKATICSGTNCIEGVGTARPQISGTVPWLFNATCNLDPKTVILTNETRYHSLTTQQTVETPCPPAPPTIPTSTGWVRPSNDKLTVGWSSTSDSARVTGYKYRISLANKPLATNAPWKDTTIAETNVPTPKPGAKYIVEIQAINKYGPSTAKLTYITTIPKNIVTKIVTDKPKITNLAKITVKSKTAGSLSLYPCLTPKTNITKTYHPAGTTTLYVTSTSDSNKNVCILNSEELDSLSYQTLQNAGVWTTVTKPTTTIVKPKINSQTTLNLGGKTKIFLGTLSITSTDTKKGTLTVGTCGTKTGKTVTYGKGVTKIYELFTSNSLGNICVTPTTGNTQISWMPTGYSSQIGTIKTLCDSTL